MRFRLFVVLLLCACQPESENTSAKPSRSSPVHWVETQPVSLNTSGVKHRYIGTVEAQHKTRIYNQEEGQIQTFTLEAGDRVKKNQVLVQINSKQLSAELEKAIANQDKADADLQRIAQMHTVKLASDVEMMQVETALKVTIAERNILNLRIAATTIQAPFGGIVLETLVEQGNVIPRYTQLMTLIDPTLLMIKLPISEFLLPVIAVNDKPSMTTLNDQRLIPGTISKILPQIDPISKQGTIEIRIPQVSPPLVIGQSVEVILSTPQLARLTIPFRALQRDHEAAFVYLVELDKIQKRSVIAGNFIGNKVEISQGLHQGEAVVTKGFIGLKPNKAVKVINPTTSIQAL